MGSFRIVDLGCKVNRYDGEVVRSALRRLGFAEAGDDERSAQVVVLNACAVTDRAVAKGRRTLRRLRRAHPDARVILTGCMTEGDLSGYREAAPGLLALPARDRSDVEATLRGFLADVRPRNARHPLPPPVPERTWFEGRTRAFLKVQDGCDARCSFCVIPATRGPARSRPAAEIEEEAAALLRAGFAELVLCGVHLGHYGRDTGDDLVSLAGRLARLPGDFRLRLSSLEVTEVDERLARLLAEQPRIARHLHVPLQSADDGVLRRMRRPYTAALFRRRIEALRRIVPDVALTTDVICGFPGEDDEAHRRTARFVRELGFSALHVFPFSPRRGTEAATLDGQVAPAAVRRRVAQMLRVDRVLRRRAVERHVGAVCEVVAERTEGSRALGFCSHYLRVRAAGLSPGRRRPCRMVAAQGDGLLAEVCA